MNREPLPGNGHAVVPTSESMEKGKRIRTAHQRGIILKPLIRHGIAFAGPHPRGEMMALSAIVVVVLLWGRAAEAQAISAAEVDHMVNAMGAKKAVHGLDVDGRFASVLDLFGKGEQALDRADSSHGAGH